MKRLFILRHAKSSWGDHSLADFDRPLAERGERDAPRMGRAFQNLKVQASDLKEQGASLDRLFSSPAKRARQTAKRFSKAAEIAVETEFDDRIYGASSSELKSIVRKLPSEADNVMIVGHNPGFEDLVSRLTGQSRHMPTCALACIEFKGEWSDVEDGSGKVLLFMIPKELDEKD